MCAPKTEIYQWFNLGIIELTTLWVTQGNGRTLGKGWPRNSGSNPEVPTNLNVHLYIGVWCNGNTEDFGSLVQGSNPCTPTKQLLDLVDLVKWIEMSSQVSNELEDKW